MDGTPSKVILVVDDEESVRKLVTNILKRQGYSVLEATNAPTAIEVAKKDHFDLLLTDVDMPVFDGLWLARQLKLQKPLLRVLYMTGGFRPDLNGSCLHKPFVLSNFITTVAQAFDKDVP